MRSRIRWGSKSPGKTLFYGVPDGEEYGFSCSIYGECSAFYGGVLGDDQNREARLRGPLVLVGGEGC